MPWGRPDYALFQFTKKMLDNQVVDVYNYGKMKRDFTYVEDILDGIEIVLNDQSIESNEIFNIGRGKQVELMDFVKEIEDRACDTCCAEHATSAKINLAPRHPQTLWRLGVIPRNSNNLGTHQK